MKRDTKLSEIKLNLIEFFGKRGLLLGRYTKNERGRYDFYPHFAWGKTFKSIPLGFALGERNIGLGNLYIMKPKAVA